MGYEDNPNANLDYLKSLTKEELNIYLKGYIQACLHLRESFNGGKINLLNKILCATSSKEKQELLYKIELLDKYEEAIRVKEANLVKRYPSLSTQVFQGDC